MTITAHHAVPVPVEPTEPRATAPLATLGAVSHGVVRVVVVLTVTTANGPRGITLSSLTPVSVDPPLVLAAIRSVSRLHRALTAATHFGVSMLAADQEPVARHFASRRLDNRDQFADVAHRIGPITGAPLLDGAIGWLECRTFRVDPTGDHSLIIGDVVDEIRNEARRIDPLLHGNGGYRRLRLA